MFSLRPLDELEALLDAHAAAPDERRRQRALADEMTALVHGEDAARAADEAADVLFGGDPTARRRPPSTAVGREVPRRSASGRARRRGALLVLTDLASSKGDARRHAGAGYRANGVRSAPTTDLSAVELLHGRYLLLRKGRTSYHLVEIFFGVRLRPSQLRASVSSAPRSR